MWSWCQDFIILFFFFCDFHRNTARSTKKPKDGKRDDNTTWTTTNPHCRVSFNEFYYPSFVTSQKQRIFWVFIHWCNLIPQRSQYILCLCVKTCVNKYFHKGFVSLQNYTVCISLCDQWSDVGKMYLKWHIAVSVWYNMPHVDCSKLVRSDQKYTH